MQLRTVITEAVARPTLVRVPAHQSSVVKLKSPATRKASQLFDWNETISMGTNTSSLLELSFQLFTCAFLHLQRKGLASLKISQRQNGLLWPFFHCRFSYFLGLGAAHTLCPQHFQIRWRCNCLVKRRVVFLISRDELSRSWTSDLSGNNEIGSNCFTRKIKSL